jgi:DNA modification methylase
MTSQSVATRRTEKSAAHVGGMTKTFTPWHDSETVRVYTGDSRDVLTSLATDSVDHIICDPPYEINFTRKVKGSSWDRTGIAFDVELWEEALRVLKPGGNLVAFGASRTYHRLAVAIEDAGFELRDNILAWIYGQGMPKSTELARDLTKLGEPELADRFAGWETQLKPAFEPMVLARKPMDASSLARNIVAHGTGGLNIDAVRIPTDEDRSRRPGDGEASTWRIERGTERSESHAGGRWPTNVLLCHHPLCSEDGDCFTTCQVAELGEQGKRSDPTRYFPIFRYESKARGAERPSGAGVTDHSTIKPLKLMDWIVQLIAAPGQVVLDIFAGSGTTVEACIRNGVRVIGIDLDEANVPAIAERIARAEAAL